MAGGSKLKTKVFFRWHGTNATWRDRSAVDIGPGAFGECFCPDGCVEGIAITWKCLKGKVENPDDYVVSINLIFRYGNLQHISI